MSSYAKQLIGRSLHQPVDGFKRRQGKRIRGSIVDLSYRIAGGNGRAPAAIVEAIECLHAGSLVIDDVQDGSRLRRGEATLHTAIGVPLAINAGNWMYFRALECLGEAPFPEAQRAKLLRAMLTAARRCHEGQALDLTARVDTIPGSRWDELATAISTLKTGVLVELAIQLGCIAAKAPPGLVSRLQTFGRQIGIALQMRNDLGELSKTNCDAGGEDRHSPVRDDDLRNARVIWPWVWAYQQIGDEGCQTLLRRLGTSLADRQAVAGELLSITQAHGDRVIARTIHEQVRLLGEHTIDHGLLEQLRDRLRPITSSPKQPTTAGGSE